jgi:hypothetical protein
MMTIKATMID